MMRHHTAPSSHISLVGKSWNIHLYKLVGWLKVQQEAARDVISLVLSCARSISPLSDDLFTCLVFFFLSRLVTDSASLHQFELFIQVLSTCHNSMLSSSQTTQDLPPHTSALLFSTDKVLNNGGRSKWQTDRQTVKQVFSGEDTGRMSIPARYCILCR